METKICNKCNVEKNIEEFRYRKYKNIYYYVSICKKCEREENKIRSRKYHYEHRDEILIKQHERYKNNKEKYAERNRQYRINNIDKIKEYEKKRSAKRLQDPIYLEKKRINREKYKTTRNLKEREKRKNDLIYKLKTEVRNMINNSFSRKEKQKSKHTEELLGCNIEFFIDYLLQTFKNNYGYEWDKKEKVHIDHIIPLATADTEEEVMRLCNYKNLQLLKAKDNLKKGSKINFNLKGV